MMTLVIIMDSEMHPHECHPERRTPNQRTCCFVPASPSNLEPATQVIPGAIQSFAKQSGDLDGGVVPSRFNKLQIAHRNVRLLRQGFLGQLSGRTQPADVLTEMMAIFSGHRLDCGRSKAFDSEACFVFFWADTPGSMPFSIRTSNPSVHLPHSAGSSSSGPVDPQRAPL